MHTHSYQKINTVVGIILFFVAINLYFNFPLWNQVLRDDSQTVSYHGELLLLHLSGETVYQNILRGVNPFATNPSLMYPFGASYAVNDLAPINGFYFLLLRPFLSIHQSVSVIAAASILLTHICAYLLLRRLKISVSAALVMATSFGFTPLLAARMGAQVSYDSLFLYPLVGIFLHALATTNKVRSKVFCALGLGLSGSIFVLSNLNYTIILIIMLALYLGFALCLSPLATFRLIKKNILYLALNGAVAALLLAPWLKQVYQLVATDGIPHGSSAGVVEYSGHLLGFFIPSQWNNFYQPLMNKLYTISPYMATQSEGFVYPGIIIVSSVVLYLFMRKRLPAAYRQKVTPHLLVAMTGALLSLGPYLHLGSRYIFSVAGHDFPIRLPFVVMQHIPFLNNFRSPGRLALILVAAGTIFTAYLLEYVLRRIRTTQLRSIITTLLLCIVLIDQNFMHVKASPQTLPNTIYQELAQDSDHGTVMEIPFTLRDGLQYLGSVDAIFYQLGHFTYPNAIIGTHTGRINQYVLDYYRNNAFVGYIGQLIDRDPVHAKLTDPLGVSAGAPINQREAIAAINFLDLDVVILNTKEPYATKVASLLTQLGYAASTHDNGFALYRRLSPDEDKLCVPFGTEEETLYLGRGWDDAPDALPARWVIGKHASFFVKTATNRQVSKLEFSAQSLTDNKMEVMIAGRMSTIDLQAGEHDYELALSSALPKGLTPIYLTFDTATAPKSVVAGSEDGRLLSARFSKLCVSSL